MNYDVFWIPAAEQELAAIWLASDDRNAVTLAAHRLEERLDVGRDSVYDVDFKMCLFSCVNVDTYGPTINANALIGDAIE